MACIITPSTNFDPLESLRLLEKHQATMCYFVPTQWQQICECPEVAGLDLDYASKQFAANADPARAAEVRVRGRRAG